MTILSESEDIAGTQPKGPPQVNLRRSLRVGAWNVLSLREDDHLSLLSSELKRLDIGIAALSEVQSPDSGNIMACGYTHYWSGCSDGYHAPKELL